MLYARHKQYHPTKVTINMARSANVHRENYQFNRDGIGNRSQIYYQPDASAPDNGSKASLFKQGGRTVQNRSVHLQTNLTIESNAPAGEPLLRNCHQSAKANLDRVFNQQSLAHSLRSPRLGAPLRSPFPAAAKSLMSRPAGDQ